MHLVLQIYTDVNCLLYRLMVSCLRSVIAVHLNSVATEVSTSKE